MGYERNHAIVITGSHAQETTISDAHAFAVSTGACVSPLSGEVVNRKQSFCVFPDGSKEGWPESDVGDSQRARIIAWLDSRRYDDGSSPLSWVEVQYGDDERKTKVTAHSDEPKRTAA